MFIDGLEGEDLKPCHEPHTTDDWNMTSPLLEKTVDGGLASASAVKKKQRNRTGIGVAQQLLVFISTIIIK